MALPLRRAARGRGVLPLLLLAACSAAPTGPFGSTGPDAYELANIAPWNVVPNSPPARFVSVFERVCLDGPRDPDAAARSLRAMDYVEVPGSGPLRSFVVDDSRPAVMIARDGSACAVGAESRTGQTERARALVLRRFPAATPLDPTPLGAEQAWAAGGAVIFLQRDGAPDDPARLLLAISGRASETP